MRRIKVGLVALAALALLPPSEASRAQEAYPTRLVRIVVPYPAGGGTDTLARLLAEQLSRKWGQTAIVENIGGAAGNIGSAEVARATPDGYTLLLASPGPIATNAFSTNRTRPANQCRGKPRPLLFRGFWPNYALQRGQQKPPGTALRFPLGFPAPGRILDHEAHRQARDRAHPAGRQG
jgi:Tripartite tricarboxylate transporter family receptor